MARLVQCVELAALGLGIRRKLEVQYRFRQIQTKTQTGHTGLTYAFDTKPARNRGVTVGGLVREGDLSHVKSLDIIIRYFPFRCGAGEEIRA